MTTTDQFHPTVAGLLAGSARHTKMVEGRHTITMTRHFDTGIDDLWDACTNPERLRRWIGELRGERQLGGKLELVMSEKCEDIAALTIEQCREPDYLQVVWSFPHEPETEVRLLLHSVSPAQTILTLEHAGLERGLAIRDGAGWEDFLVRLDAAVRGADPATVNWPAVEAAVSPLWTAVVDAASAEPPAVG